MVKVLVADDEKLSRETIKLLMQQYWGEHRLWEADNGIQALEIAEAEQPDLIFLDIEMPGMNGIEVASQLPQCTVVIFVTAYDEYAVSAFELNAIDYLLKPFDDDRFEKAINRAKDNIQEKQLTDYTQISSAIEHIIKEQSRQYKTRLVIRDPGRIRLIDVSEINYISGAGNYAEIHLHDGKMVMHRETLSTLEQQLNPEDFVRIHRSSIVRRTSISELRPNDKGDYSVILTSGEVLTLSRRNRDKLEELTG